ncbi:MAG: M23 family metallopeptidase [Actinomycetota bacterium]
MGVVVVGAVGAHRLTSSSAAVGAPGDGSDGVPDTGSSTSTSTTSPPTIEVADNGGTLQDAASALEPAERVGRRIGFPVEVHDNLVLLDTFGRFQGSRVHQGVDIGRSDGASGDALLACVDGVLVEQFRPGDALGGDQGNSWVLQAANGYAYRYHHLEEFAPGLEVGSAVAVGDVIGTMGATGNTVWPHLHFEVRPTGPIGTPVDPMEYLRPVPDDVTVF